MTDLKPIQVCPSQKPTVRRLLDSAAEAARVEAAHAILRSHPDPLIRECCAIIAPALSQWADALRATERQRLLDMVPFDDHALALSRDADVVTADHNMRVTISPAADGVWIAATAPPKRVQPGASGWPAWSWKLNGDTVQGREQRAVKPGDVIVVEQDRFTLTEPDQ